MDLASEQLNARTKSAIDYAVRFGGIDGAHHKTWVIDQMVRALTGGHVVDGVQVATYEYMKLIREACDGEDGPGTYDWDVGTPP